MFSGRNVGKLGGFCGFPSFRFMKNEPFGAGAYDVREVS